MTVNRMPRETQILSTSCSRSGEERRQADCRSDSLIESVYLPPRDGQGWRLEDLLGTSDIRYFSFGRYAVAEALRLSKVRAGDKVALPGLICRDLLSSLHAVGAEAVFYPVGLDLAPALPQEQWPEAKAILAVNYFGLPQALRPFRDYCRRTGAVLIEDNAHGLLSRDEEGRPLGTRGDLGIFSLRKTLPLWTGAALVAEGGRFQLREQERFDPSPPPSKYRLKQAMRRLVPVLGARSFSGLIRRIQRATRSSAAQEGDCVESRLPMPAAPPLQLAGLLPSDAGEETCRRRALFGLVESLLMGYGPDLQPVVSSLPAEAVPYGYPFYAGDGSWTHAARLLADHGLRCITWPDLPRVLAGTAPSHYKRLRLVPFLW